MLWTANPKEYVYIYVYMYAYGYGYGYMFVYVYVNRYVNGYMYAYGYLYGYVYFGWDVNIAYSQAQHARILPTSSFMCANISLVPQS